LGININDKIFDLKFGQILKCPKDLTEIKGSHAIVLIGYLHELNCFVARNSFGIKYCAQGYFLISYNYIISSFSYDLFILAL
jgi:C1A family cysteine protease